MTSKEQTISNLKKLKSFHNGSYGADINRAIKALEQEPILDKIRAEIEFEVDHRTNMLCAEDVFAIIDKYTKEGAEE